MTGSRKSSRVRRRIIVNYTLLLTKREKKTELILQCSESTLCLLRVCRIHTKQNLEFYVIEHTTMRIQIKSTYIQHTLRSAEFCSECYFFTCSSLIRLNPFHKLNPQQNFDENNRILFHHLFF